MTKKIIILKIISEYKIVINAGEREGVKIKDEFYILDDTVRVLQDPETNEILAEFPGYKDYVVVDQVEEKYSICSTPVRFTNPQTNLNQTVLAFAKGISADREIQHPLNVSEYDIDNILSKYTNSAVLIGDELKKK